MQTYFIEAPTVAKSRPEGLMSVANVIDDGPGMVFYAGVDYQTVLAGQSRVVPTDGSDKVFEEVPLIHGDPFSIYRGLDYSLFQQDLAAMTAEEIFAGGESFAVERAVQDLILNPKGVDLTPTKGTPVTNPQLALGLLEQYAAEQYNGLPLIHSNRLGIHLMEWLEVDKKDPENWKMYSKLGTPIAIGSGYHSTGPGGVVAPNGSAWLYVTGQVNIWRGKPVRVEGPNLPRNRHLALAEAQYVPTVETIVAAILVGA